MKQSLLFAILLIAPFLLHAQETSPEIGIVGPAANGWPDGNNPTPDIMLTNNGDGTYSISALTLTTGAAKFRENQEWTTSYGGDSFPTGPITNGDIPVQAGVYDIVLDLNNQTYSFTDVSTFTEIELTGSAVAAGNSPMMNTIDGTNYSLSVTQFINGNVVFRESGTNTYYGTDAFPIGTATQGGDSIPVVGGFYKVNFSLIPTGDASVNQSAGDFQFVIPEVGIVGSAAAGWPDGNNPTPDILMNTTDGDVYTLDNQVLTDGQLKFRQDLDWSVNWGGDSFPNGTFTGNDINVTAGTYNITFNRSAGTYSFVTLSVADISFTNFRLYPNPTKDIWVFENPNQNIKEITIFNSLGKQVYQANFDSTVGEVNGSVFLRGLYLAKVELTNGKHTTVKLFKE